MRLRGALGLLLVLGVAVPAWAAETRQPSPLERAAKQRESGTSASSPAATRPPKTWSVGPSRELKRPSNAAAVALDGDTVEIDAGIYQGDVATWSASNLTIRGVGGYAELRANGQSAQGKGIWVTRGGNLRIEKITFADAKVPDRNGAGIRHEGGDLTIVDCVFRDNENGILTATISSGDLRIERSEFARNGHPSGLAHGIYINQVKSLTVVGSYFHGTNGGHLIKSRSGKTVIAFNRIMDEEQGRSSYNIDLPNGGLGYVVGNLIQQGPRTENNAMIAFGLEGPSFPGNTLYLINNTLVNEFNGGSFVRARGDAVHLVNNILVGPGQVVEGIAITANNLLVGAANGAPAFGGPLDGGDNRGNRRADDLRMVDPRRYDYHLAAGGGAAAGVGLDVTKLLAAGGLKLDSEYQHPRQLRPRRLGPPFDIGAHAVAR